MADTVAVEIDVPKDVIDSLKRYTLDSLMLDGEVPREIKYAIVTGLALKMEGDPLWESIAEAIIGEVESRKGDIVQSIADRITAQLSKGINHAASQLVQKLGEKLKNVRI